MAKPRHHVPGHSAVNPTGLIYTTYNDIFRVACHSYISHIIFSSAFQPFGNCRRGGLGVLETVYPLHQLREHSVGTRMERDPADIIVPSARCNFQEVEYLSGADIIVEDHGSPGRISGVP